MEKINGFQNEHNFSKYLNGNQVKFLNPLFQELITTLYGELSKDTKIKCHVDYEKKKYDLVIEVNGIMKRVSIKKGIMNSVHVEGIYSFIHFLIDSGIPKDIITKYLNYYYADGTTNGSGTNRLSAAEYKLNHQKEIDEINAALNNDYIIKRAINRFLLQGKNSNIQVDAIIYGVVDDFLFLTKEMVEEIVLSKKNIYSTGVHFADLYCQPLTRNLNHKEESESKRFLVQIKWYSIFDDILEYQNNHVQKIVC